MESELKKPDQMETEKKMELKMDKLNLSSSSDSDSSDSESQAPKSKTITDRGEIVEKYSTFINVEPMKKGPKTTRDRSNRATVEQVLDPRTMRFLAKIINKGIISRINGCISTGKEANVYHGDHEDPAISTREYAVKIYKTSILVFKDRERYVDGEFRFRNTKNQSNPRKMVKVWAEKEFRNLKRLYMNGIPCPEPVELRSHVLVMEYLTKGNAQPSPKLRDHPFKDINEIVHYYQQMLFYMRRMYQTCRLVHADLSEYNSIVHNDKLYIIDVSQSVEPEHPMALDFLRMDIKNVNDFFSRKNINVYPERLLFKYITENNYNLGLTDDSDESLGKYLEALPLKSELDESNLEDEVFRSLHLVRSLNQLEERDFEKFAEGKVDTLTDLVVKGQQKETDSEEESSEESSEDSGSDEESEDEKPAKEWVERDSVLKGKKHEDKESKKLRKSEAKAAKAEKRKTKMKKHVKKKLVNKRKTP
ncbi:putative serine/threonine-protein kinase [Clavispora lusitaniae]|uniref:Serine/threonine-protein kinase n=1 Tax=Clavispora lusitaniae TaxID=36911 RepID=A0ACD0WGU7_CLALS|nr:putative serine/threonine-protein kinase [Clavispora lusitaniae]QFZ32472.1 putative serine/threonine-protein kinase [Clavispora lusitaniae]QFZ38141.1 putative serine/threonine-protein kinase [Clavispora lusitaniae]QFZ43824.1 putative serine/threonine-protein kinase [Clavispora lusitaniae]QFZ49501.1 putative serine/threonine-protein kinase [Clavispora lusitaniae]